jgi:hypothetical protein
MADRKISDLTALTTPASGDYLPIVDISEAAAASKNKRITIEELMRGVPDGTAAAPGIAFETDPNTGIYSPGANQLAVATNGVGRLFVDASGNIQIKESSNAVSTGASLYLFDTAGAAGSGNSSGRICFYSSDSTDGPSIRSEISSYYENSSADAALLFKTYNGTLAERLRITSAGLVGIGTSAPSVRLQVQNSIAGGSGGTIATLHNFSDTGGDTRYSGLNFVIGSDNGTSAIRAARTNSSTNYETNLSFWTNPTGATQTPVQRMTLDSTGRLGIGSSSPGYALDVVGTVNSNALFRASNGTHIALLGSEAFSAGVVGVGSGSNHPLVLGTNSAERARIDTSGRLLVGTSSSSISTSLVVQGNSAGTASGQMYLQRDDSTPSSGNKLADFNFADSSGNRGASISALCDGTWTAGSFHPGALTFSTTSDSASSPTERMRITSDAYVRLAAGTGGIQFNGDTAAANALDDYEEGTWTPTVLGTSTPGTYTVVASGATYRKVGKLVHVQARISFSAASGGTGNLQIAGLPFSYTAAQAISQSVNLNDVNFSGGNYINVVHTGAGVANTLFLMRIIDGGSSAPLAITSISATSSIQFGIVFVV